ncbi:MAG: RNA polymerase sigma factor [Spirosomataceae bacterium]
MSENEKDLILLNRIRKGDKSAYAVLINRHKSYAFTIAFRILNIREDAEEVAQDAFIQVFNGLDSFNADSKFTTWFYRIVFNAALMYKRKKRILSSDFEDSREALQVDSFSDSSGELLQNERQIAIKACLEKLSSDDVTIITLFYLKELTLDEVASIIEISAETAKVKLHRARKRLMEEMKKQLKDEVKNLL